MSTLLSANSPKCPSLLGMEFQVSRMQNLGNGDESSLNHSSGISRPTISKFQSTEYQCPTSFSFGSTSIPISYHPPKTQVLTVTTTTYSECISCFRQCRARKGLLCQRYRDCNPASPLKCCKARGCHPERWQRSTAIVFSIWLLSFAESVLGSFEVRWARLFVWTYIFLWSNE